MVKGEGKLDAIFKEVINTRGIYTELGYKTKGPITQMRLNYKNGNVSLQKKIEIVTKAGFDVEILTSKK